MRSLASFSRYVLNQPSTLTDELARFLMIWVGLLGAAYTVGAQRHLSIDLLFMSINKRKQALLSLFINLLILALQVQSSLPAVSS